MTQEIIVYRNPLEKNFYDMIQEYPEVFLGIIGCMILVVAGCVLYGKVRDWLARRRNRRYNRW